MQEQVNEKTVALSVKASKLSGRVLAKAMAAALRQIKKQHNKPKAGHQSIKRLNRTGGSGDMPSIEVKGRIKSFEAIARRNEVGYHIETDKSTNPPTHTVYFKANKTEAITAAFTEYTRKMLGRRNDKPSVLNTLHQLQKTIKNKTVDRVRNKEMGLER